MAKYERAERIKKQYTKLHSTYNNNLSGDQAVRMKLPKLHEMEQRQYQRFVRMRMPKVMRDNLAKSTKSLGPVKGLPKDHEGHQDHKKP